MNKFKPGDIVVAIGKLEPKGCPDIHSYNLVKNCKGIVLQSHFKPYVLWENINSEIAFYEHQLMLEELYNSPLAQAMREEHE